MKEDLKRITGILHDRLNAIKNQGYTVERLDAVMNALAELDHKLYSSDPLSSMGLDIGEMVDDGTVDGD